MAWPDWIEELRERYLADESNVFVLHGAVRQATFVVEGHELDCVGVLRTFLSRSRPIVGILRPWPQPSRLDFAGVQDRTLFENLVKAHNLVEGHLDYLRDTHPSEALARIWRALSTTGTDQAYVITESERLLPGHRARTDPIPNAPSLLEWPLEPSLRRSNNIVIFTCDTARGIREELVERSAGIEVRVPAAPVGGPELEPVGAPLDVSAPEPAPEPAPAERVPDLEEIRQDLEAALLRTLLAHPREHLADRLPVMDAVAQVLGSHRADLWGSLQMGLDEEGEVQVTGAGADRFRQAWRSDIALDAAAGMLIRELPEAYGDQQPPALDATALGALSKRVKKLLQKL